MMVGAAEIEITPQAPVDLSGFAARVQPMIGVLDPIYAKALYLENEGQKLLWLNCDVLALSAAFVAEYRSWAASELDIHHVLLSATHTHAAPATVGLTGCGQCDEAYLQWLQVRAREAARIAVLQKAPGELSFRQIDFPMAIDRRGKASAHVDSILSILGWQRAGSEWIAMLLNYPMHPVALGHVNRKVSADWCGAAARELHDSLPGQPIAAITNGACGNLNPPDRPVSAEKVAEYGRHIGEQASRALAAATADEHMRLSIAVEHVDLPLETMPADQIDRIAEQRINEFENTDWAKPFRDAISTWRDTQKLLITSGGERSIDIELFAIDLGPVVILAISGELFSRFTAMLRQRINKPLLVVGYANSVFGYIPTAQAYDEGGYEVDQAHFFYNSLRPQKGGLEMLAERAARLIEMLQ